MANRLHPERPVHRLRHDPTHQERRAVPTVPRPRSTGTVARTAARASGVTPRRSADIATAGTPALQTDERQPFRIGPRPPQRGERRRPVLEMGDHLSLACARSRHHDMVIRDPSRGPYSRSRRCDRALGHRSQNRPRPDHIESPDSPLIVAASLKDTYRTCQRRRAQSDPPQTPQFAARRCDRTAGPITRLWGSLWAHLSLREGGENTRAITIHNSTYGSSFRLRCYPFTEGHIDHERPQKAGGRSATSPPSGPTSFQPGEFEARYYEQAAVALTHLICPPGFPVRFMSDCWALFFWTNRCHEISDDN